MLDAWRTFWCHKTDRGPSEKDAILNKKKKFVTSDDVEFDNQVLLTMAVSIGYLTIGLVRGFSSPAVPSMKELDPYLVPDEDAVSWVSAVPPLFAFVGSLVAGPLLQLFGRKRTLQFCSPIFLIAWLLIALAVDYIMMVSARALTGFCVGITLPAAQIYVNECSHPEVRGILGTLPALFMAGGILVSYLLGAWLPWNFLAYASAAFPAVLFLVLLPLPESPVWLLSKGLTHEADLALAWLHHQPRINTPQEKLQMSVFSVSSENSNSEPKTVDPATTENSNPYSFSELFRKPVLLPFIMSFMILIFQQVSGIDTVVFYTVDIFAAASSSIDEHLATIVVGVVQLLAIILSLFLIDRYGRRPLLLSSGGLMFLSMVTLGTHFYLQEFSEELSSQLGYVPIISLVVFMIGYSIGYGSIPYLLMGELIPARQRSVLSSIAGSMNLGVMFLVIKTYPNIKDAIGTYGAFWMYAALCLTSCIYVCFIIPETKGKSLTEIEEYFERKHTSKERPHIEQTKVDLQS